MRTEAACVQGRVPAPADICDHKSPLDIQPPAGRIGCPFVMPPEDRIRGLPWLPLPIRILQG